jgi:hypothetical protein
MIINQAGVAMMTRKEHQEFLDRVREAGRKINPETARIWAEIGYVLNVYDLSPFGEDNYGATNYFAFEPESELWVWFEDIPEPIRNRLEARVHNGELEDADGVDFLLGKG